jgi:hypothetical protein
LIELFFIWGLWFCALHANGWAHPWCRVHPYAASKAAADLLVTSYRRRLISILWLYGHSINLAPGRMPVLKRVSFRLSSKKWNGVKWSKYLAMANRHRDYI